MFVELLYNSICVIYIIVDVKMSCKYCRLRKVNGSLQKAEHTTDLHYSTVARLVSATRECMLLFCPGCNLPNR